MRIEPIIRRYLVPAAACLTAVRLSDQPALAVRNWGLLCILAWISAEDILERRIPNRCIAAGTAMWLACPVLMGKPLFTGLSTDMIPGILSGFFTALFCGLIAAILSRKTGRTMMGAGDCKLLFLAAAVLGWERGLYMLFFSCCLGLVTWIVQLPVSRKQQAEFPFGPAISMSFSVLLFTGL